jgi:tRNA-specific adenosine deaminase 1
MEISGDEIADVVLNEFDKWPAKRKPLVRSDGVKEWVPLSGIVAQGLPLKWLAEDHEADNWDRER